MNATNTGVISKLPSNKLILFCVIMMFVTAVGAGVNSFMILQDADHDARYLELTGEMRVLSQTISTTSRQATAGESAAANGGDAIGDA